VISLLPWKLVKCDWDVGLEISFHNTAFVLKAKFGSTLEGRSFDGHAARQVTELTLTSEMQGTVAPLHTKQQQQQSLYSSLSGTTRLSQ